MGVDPSPHSSIRRKIRGSLSGLNLADNHGGSSHRQSLAFELAAAMEPEENDQASILDQLGLGDDDVDEAEDQMEEEEEEEQEDVIYEEGEYDGEQYPDESSLAHQLQQPRLRMQPSCATLESTHTQQSSLSNVFDPSPRKSSIRASSLFTPNRVPKSKVSRSTLNIIDSSPHKSLANIQVGQLGYYISDGHDQSPVEVDEDGKEDLTFDSGQTYEDLDSSEGEHDSGALQAGLKSTAKFLDLLKQSNTDCNVTLRQNSPQTHRTHASTKTSTAEEFNSDRQPIVEKMITDIVRTMTEQVRDRESQIRELKEIEIALSRTDKRTLADLEALPDFLKDEDYRNSAILGKFTAPSDHPSLSTHQSIKSIEDLQQVDSLDNDEVDDNEELEGGRLTPTNARLSQTRDSSTDQTHIKLKDGDANRKKTMENLGELKLITNSLISSLNQIHEHTQISRQTQIEIVRKLKGVRGLVINWKSDFDSIQNSIDFITNWELDLFPTTRDYDSREDGEATRQTGNKIRGIFEVQLKLAKDEVEKLLNDAFLNASTLLQPPSSLPSLNHPCSS